MLFLRPVTLHDHGELLALAQQAGIGMTSLPADGLVLEKKIARAVASFEGHKEALGDEAFLFVLEDSETKALAGSAGVVCHVGLKTPFYSYKLSTIVQASPEVGVYSRQRVLHMVNDYTGVSEIGSLFLQDAYRQGGMGRFLSRARFLMMAAFPHLFAERVIAEIRGVQDEKGESPFYKHLAQHFFQMPFQSADFINATQGSQFISDLMPKYPIYVNLLHPAAQEVIGKPFGASEGAMHLLQKEGFIYQGYVDLFDAGPTMQIERRNIETIRNSRNLPLKAVRPLTIKPDYMVCGGALAQFRSGLAALEVGDEGVVMDAEAAKVLQLQVGDMIHFVMV